MIGPMVREKSSSVSRLMFGCFKKVVSAVRPVGGRIIERGRERERERERL
jgi:hypothetical protein